MATQGSNHPLTLMRSRATYHASSSRHAEKYAPYKYKAATVWSTALSSYPLSTAPDCHLPWTAQLLTGGPWFKITDDYGRTQ